MKSIKNIFALNKRKQIEYEHRMIIGIIINGCRYPRPPKFDSYLNYLLNKLTDLDSIENLTVDKIRSYNVLEIKMLLCGYTDEQINDILILLNMSVHRFNPSEPIKRIASRKRITIKRL